jgi:hypothetical protein
MSNAALHALTAAVSRILRPLIRILLRHGVSYNTFADIAKSLYVDVAMEEFGIEGRKPSVSRTSIITGLTRKEVMRVRQNPKPEDSATTEQYNRAARVISAWLRDSQFVTPDGQPAVLTLDGNEPTFAALVKRHSGDMPTRAVLDELLRVGAVVREDDGRIRLVSHAYIPHSSEADKLHILGTDVGYLVSTIDHNLQHGRETPRFQRKVSYDNLPDDILPEFRVLSAAQAQALLEHLDRWLSQHDRDNNPAVPGTGRNRAGVGIYYFEEPYREED